MDMVKKILGILIFALLGILFFGFEILTHGWAITLLSIIITSVIVGLVVLGAWLLSD